MSNIIKLSGYSGCSLQLIDNCNGQGFVRKVSASVEYNSRLISQCNKQESWNSEIAKTPMVIDSGYVDELFYFDMEYINGSTISSLIVNESINIDDISDFLTEYYRQQYVRKIKCKDVADLSREKVLQLNELKLKHPDFYNLHKALDMLSSNDWVSSYTTASHGDLTFENIIKSNVDGGFYLIDFLDDFSNSLYTDLSKLLQDLLGMWSFIDKSKGVNSLVETNALFKILHIRKKVLGNISSIEPSDFLKSAIFGLLLNYVRIVPYIKHDYIRIYIDKQLESTIEMIENNTYNNLTF